MKIRNIISIAALAALSLASCDKDWNDQFEGLDQMTEIVDVQTIDYTLTDADYALMVSAAKNMSAAHQTELAAVGAAKAFDNIEQARTLIPYYLAYSGGSFRTLSDGSAVKVTYNKKLARPFTLTDNEYKKIWGSDTVFGSGVADSNADKLKENVPVEGLAEGDFVLVRYNYYPEEPDFNAVGPVKAAFGNYLLRHGDGSYTTWGVYDTERGSLPYLYKKNGDKWEAVATVDDIEADYTFVAEKDGTRYLFTVVEAGKTYGYPAGTEVTIDGVLGTATIDGTNVQENNTVHFADAGNGTYTMSDNSNRYYYQSGTYNSFNLAAELAEGANGYVKFTAVPAFTTEVKYALYVFDGTVLVEAEPETHGYTELSQEDYESMGLAAGFVATPETYLPRLCAQKMPYAQSGDSQILYYKTSEVDYALANYVFDGAVWASDTTETDQFVRANSTWKWDPSVVITLTPGRNLEPSATWFQAVTDWVYENIDVPMGSSSNTSGMYFVTKYGNNEYYTGSSAYQGNVDFRPSAAKGQYGGDSYQGAELVAAGIAFPGDSYENAKNWEGAEWDGLTTDQRIQTLMLKRLKYVMGKVLSKLYPDATPIDGMEVTYTINLGIYTGTNLSACNATLVYRVSAPAEFEFVELRGYSIK